MKLTLIRHGITEGNILQVHYGMTDLPIIPLGVEELKKKKENYIYPAADYYYTSGLKRTEQTFRIIYGNLPHESLSGLEEMHFGEFEMKNSESLKENIIYQEWWYGKKTEVINCPGGESGNEVKQRALETLKPMLERNKDAVCITHAGIISRVMCEWFKGVRDSYITSPGTGYTVEFQQGKPMSWIKAPYSRLSD